jgi:hypothetical protein
MRTILGVALWLGACGGSEPPPPTCSQAVSEFYGNGCTFIDLETNEPIASGEVTEQCRLLVANAPDSCVEPLEDWRRCLARVESPSCDCSAEQEALLTCE